jgi:hypothetical protein
MQQDLRLCLASGTPVVIDPGCSHHRQHTADLGGFPAVLCCAVLCCAVLCCAVLCCAVLCCAVLCCADPWVMREWAKNLQVDSAKILMLADGEGLFHSKLGEPGCCCCLCGWCCCWIFLDLKEIGQLCALVVM